MGELSPVTLRAWRNSAAEWRTSARERRRFMLKDAEKRVEEIMIQVDALQVPERSAKR